MRPGLRGPAAGVWREAREAREGPAADPAAAAARAPSGGSRPPGSRVRRAAPGWAEGRPERGRGAPGVFAQAWRPLRPHRSTVVIVSGHRCPSFQRRSSGRGRRLHAVTRRCLPGPGCAERRVQSCGRGAGGRDPRLSRRVWAGAAVSRPQELSLAGASQGGSHPPGTPGNRGPSSAGCARGPWGLGPLPGPRGRRTPAPRQRSASFFLPGRQVLLLGGVRGSGRSAGRPRAGCLEKASGPSPSRITLSRNVFCPAPPKPRLKYRAWPLPSLPWEWTLPTPEAQLVRIHCQRRPQGGVIRSCQRRPGL